jgi:hypothetical protein
MERIKVPCFYLKISSFSTRKFRSSHCGGRHKGGGEGIAKTPGSVRTTRSHEYFMEKIGVEMAHYTKKYPE